MRALLLAFTFACTSVVAAQSPPAPSPVIALVAQDQVPLRAAPRDSAKPHAVLWQGEALEIRGERLDYLQVYDYRRERGGYVRASQVRRLKVDAAEAPQMLSVIRFLRDMPGMEPLGIGLSAAYVQAATPDMLRSTEGIEALDALGAFATRLAHRANADAQRNAQERATLSAHLDVAARHGVQFTSHEAGGRVRVCYDGDAYRRVMALRASPEQHARAALALTRMDCGGESQASERRRLYEWRADLLDRVDAAMLPPTLRNRVHMRRAGIWATIAYQHARTGDAPEGAAQRALSELTSVNKQELTDEDQRTFSQAAMRVNASRWAAIRTPAPDAGRAPDARPRILTRTGQQPGETCVLLIDAKHGADNPLARRCTYSVVWEGSATLNREGRALALAVQPTESWRELWIFRREGTEWAVHVLPPAPTSPDIGYAEFAGWIPGGKQMLVAREAAAEGKLRRQFELLNLDSLLAVRQADEPGALDAFRRWQDPKWMQQTVSLR